MNFFENIIKDFLNVFAEPNLIYTIVIILVVGISKWIFNKFVIDKIEKIASRYRWRKISTYFSFFIIILLLSFLWLQNLKLGTFLGLFSAGLAIALRDLITNFVGWIFILWKRPFAVGDRVQIEETVGDVIDIRLFQFSVIEIGNWVDAEQSTGRIVHIPNKKLFNYNLANYTADFPFIWNEIPVIITFESDWKKTKNILLETVEEIISDQIEVARSKLKQSSRKYMIFYGKLTPIVYTQVKQHGVSLVIRYLCNPRTRRSTEADIWENILKKFSREPDIDFAYPTTRFYVRNEGQQAGNHKSGTDIEDEL